jgi:hypothetical protein
MTTGTEQTLPPMGGLALMALELAAKRAGYVPTHLLKRKDYDLFLFAPASRHYYEILDRIERGEKP